MAAKPSLSVVPEAFKIEMGVPYPDRRWGARTELMGALRELSGAPVGASIFVPLSACKAGAQLHGRLGRIGGKGWGSIRKADGGFRVWKIAEPKLR